MRAAGFREPRLTALPEVEQIERERGQRSPTDRGPRVPRYVITALPDAPAGEASRGGEPVREEAGA